MSINTQINPHEEHVYLVVFEIFLNFSTFFITVPTEEPDINSYIQSNKVKTLLILSKANDFSRRKYGYLHCCRLYFLADCQNNY